MVFMTLEDKVECAISGALENLGYEIVRIKYINSSDPILQIMIDKAEGSININDCSKVSRVISAIMDAEDVIADNYNLEISSPGINRPLVKQADFIKFKDSEAQLKLKNDYDGFRKIRGKIIGVENGQVIIEMVDTKKIEVCFDDIDSAYLV